MRKNMKRSMNMKMKKKTMKFKGLLLFLIIFVTLILLTLFITTVFAYRMLNTVAISEISKNPIDLGIKPEVEQKVENVKKENEILNIALFGIDQTDINDKGRSDVIMLLTIDKSRNKIKLSSIMRDSYVNISDRGLDKINHAYAFGGPQLAIRTINENFDLNIENYATVSFLGLEKIIDALGGVTIDVDKNEIALINVPSYDESDKNITAITPITKAGTQNLKGCQAVAYARIRYVGNGDYERTDRQRRVLTALVDKILSSGVTKYPDIVSQLLPYVNTNMNKLDILKTGMDALGSGIKTIEQERFPVDGYCQGKMINGIYYLTFDTAATTDQIFKYIYEDVKPVAK